MLSHYDASKGILVGMERLTHEAWVHHLKSDIDKSDFTWEQYTQHAEAGDGDEWLFGQDHPPGPEWEANRPRAFDTADHKLGHD